jgi:signal peptidase I
VADPTSIVSAAKRRRKTAERDSFLETLESLVVAFILAFVFRAYVVEAFVIPTGSMAPKLNGQHLELTCGNCGYKYHVGLDHDQQGRLKQWHPDAAKRCPLCSDTRVARPEEAEYKPSNAFFGDRILVLKYYYDFFEPEPWDVIVFKYPMKPELNYIKRLIGLPGQSVEVRDGDVYIDGRILRKTDKAQKSLWIPVSDTDYWDQNKGAKWRPSPVGPDTLWSWETMPLEFTPHGDDMAYLVYHHLDARGRRQKIRDRYGYNNPSSGNMRVAEGSDVTDLSLVADLEIDGPGTVEIVLEAFGDTFTFKLPSEGTGRRAWIIHASRKDGEFRKNITEGELEPLPVGRRVRIEAANVDHKLILKVDGRRLIDPETVDGVAPEGDPVYEPSIANYTGSFPANVKLGAAGARVTVHRLRVNRDVYYTGRMNGQDDGHGVGDPYKLGEDEFFVLGDNSPRSLDSRWWNVNDAEDPRIRESIPSGRSAVVPRANLVGKAFYVYWPSAGQRYGIPGRFLPDFREFRFIR